jgi:hypothetical protein
MRGERKGLPDHGIADRYAIDLGDQRVGGPGPLAEEGSMRRRRRRGADVFCPRRCVYLPQGRFIVRPRLSNLDYPTRMAQSPSSPHAEGAGSVKLTVAVTSAVTRAIPLGPGPTAWAVTWVGLPGLEPGTSSLSGMFQRPAPPAATQVGRSVALSASGRDGPWLTALSGTQRARPGGTCLPRRCREPAARLSGVTPGQLEPGKESRYVRVP